MTAMGLFAEFHDLEDSGFATAPDLLFLFVGGTGDSSDAFCSGLKCLDRNFHSNWR